MFQGIVNKGLKYTDLVDLLTTKHFRLLHFAKWIVVDFLPNIFFISPLLKMLEETFLLMSAHAIKNRYMHFNIFPLKISFFL
jgi:hypothetical protein